MPPNQQSTIYLTLEEDERLRKAFKDRLQKCQELAGQARVPSDPQSLKRNVTAASLMADMAAASISSSDFQSQKDAIAACSVGNPYPPCTVPIQDLQPMSMSELKMDTHHRGQILTVKRVAPVVKLKLSSWTVVQGEDGEMERIEVGIHLLDRLEEGEVFRVKEPWFTLSEVEQGEVGIRVDHPSDLVVLSEEAGEKTARQCKEEGNAALKAKNLLVAHEKYTQGLEIAEISGTEKGEEIRKDLYRNRAHINLLLSRFDAAKSDALSSLTCLKEQKHRELDSKAHLRAGLAAYSLGDYHSSRKLFEEQKRLMPDKDSATRIRKTDQRLKEQESGCYDFKKLKAALLISGSRSPSVDIASFTRNIEVGESSGYGRGLFVKRDIAKGEMIFAEKAFCVVWEEEKEALSAMTFDFRDDRIRVFPAGLCRSVVRKLVDNPSQVEKVVDLYGDYRGLEGGGEVADVFQVHDIVARNAFAPGLPPSSRSQEGYGGGETASTGLWIMASYMNHSCVPNSEKEFIGDLMILRATREIKAGEELMHSYVQVDSDFEGRRKNLMDTWGFECGCKLCIAESGDSMEAKRKRKALEGEAEGLMEGGGGRLVVLKMKRIVKAIEETYDTERYRGLPRMVMVRVQKWIEETAAR